MLPTMMPSTPSRAIEGEPACAFEMVMSEPSTIIVARMIEPRLTST